MTNLSHPHHQRPQHAHADAPLSRRGFLRRSSEVTLAAAITVTSAGALLNSAEAWGMEVQALSPETTKTLILIARDLYPHDKIADRFYAVAVKGQDAKAAKDAAHKTLIEGGVADLNKAAGDKGYLGLDWEVERVALLRKIEGTPFFEAVRSDLIVSLYNQPEVWPIFGYEGESYSKGGYIRRGFDDIDWI
jgi:hypothetical protein